VNEGTGGTGGAAMVNSIIPTFSTVHISDIINTFKDNKIDSASYSAPWADYTRNNHITSNTSTTFDVGYDGLSGSPPKEGDLIISFRSGETITSYTPDNSFFATVIAATGSTITYAQGSVITSASTGDVTIRGFTNNDAVTIYDLTKKRDGTAISSTGIAATFYATGGSFNINGTPTANTEAADTYGMATVADGVPLMLKLPPVKHKVAAIPVELIAVPSLFFVRS
jgi:hypothetical protein